MHVRNVHVIQPATAADWPERRVIQTPFCRTVHWAALLNLWLGALGFFFLLLKGHVPFHFHCLLLSAAATRNHAAAVCLCCCFASHQVLGPGVAPFLLLFGCIQRLPDWLAQYWRIKKKSAPIVDLCPLLQVCPSSHVIRSRNKCMSVLEDKGLYWLSYQVCFVTGWP